MIPKAPTLCLAAVLAASTVAFSGQSGPGPPLPNLDHGACPFEGCTYRDWSVLADTQLLADQRDDARIVARVQRGATVRGLTGVVVTTKLGRARVVRQATIGGRGTKVSPGDRVDLLNYRGEGIWKYWLRGLIDEAFIPDQPSCARNNPGLFNECSVQVGEPPVTLWWAKIRARDGREGWTRQLDHFGNKDRFG
jgi:hypothetical protein